MKQKIIILTFIIIFLASCAPSQNITATITPMLEQPAVTYSPTETPTNIPALSETPTAIDTDEGGNQTDTSGVELAETSADYASMTDDEKLEFSQNHVNEITPFSGDFTMYPAALDNSTNYPFFWVPSIQQWKLEGTVPADQLDKEGKTFPVMVETGFENPDGSLVNIDSRTGAEVTFPATINLPGLGEMSAKEFFTMLQSRLANWASNDVFLGEENTSPSYHDPNHQQYQEVEAILDRDLATYVAGYRYGSPTQFYPTLASRGGADDIPGQKEFIDEQQTNFVKTPIFSPETGNLMLWVNVLTGEVVGSETFTFSPDGSIVADKAHNEGQNGGTQLWILQDLKDPALTYWKLGGEAAIQGNDGVCDANDLLAVYNATTEAEIYQILSGKKICVAAPLRTIIQE